MCIAGVLAPDPSSASGWQLRHIPWSWVTADKTEDGFGPSEFVVTNPYTGGRVTFDAAVYHVSPALIWHEGTQTYASARDNARALCSEALSPILTMVRERLNAQLPARLGLGAVNYCEFDISSKLAASFEEQASVLQSSVGGPWMLRNEARARMNLPALPGADELIVPLNVTEGGLASPNDTDPTKAIAEALAKSLADALAKALPQAQAATALPHPQQAKALAEGARLVPFGDGAPVMLKSSTEPPEDMVGEIEGALTRFLGRQRPRVLQELEAAGDGWDKAAGGAGKGAKAGAWPSWWDGLRWDRELADDLEPLFRRLCDLRGMSAMADIGEAASAWDSPRTANFVRAMAEARARLFNRGTLADVRQAVADAGGWSWEAMSEVERAFMIGANNRAVRGARTFATAVCGFATKEAVRQVWPRDTDRIRRTKTWRHHGSKSPRSDHAAMDGETVGLDERFSNGADYPGDLGLSAEETVNCHCTMDVAVERRAEFSFVTDGRLRYEGVTADDLPDGVLDSIADFIDGFNARYPAIADADGTIPLGLSGVAFCDIANMAAEAGCSLGDVADAVGMFVRTADGAANAGIYLNAELLAGVTSEQALSDFRHEYGHYVGWFIERCGAGDVGEMVGAALGELLPDGSKLTSESTAIAISADLSGYAGRSWAKGLHGEVFAEAFRVWQEGGESRLAAIIGSMIDAALRGVA